MFKAQHVFFALLILLMSQSAFAATATANLPVNASVAAVCVFGNITSVNFGSFTGTQNDATGSIEVTCNPTVAYTIGLNQGTGTGGTTSLRVMTGTPTGTLAYQLFQNVGRTTNWGNNPPTDTVNSTGTGLVQLFTVYGRIPAGAVPAPGSYNDTVLITVTY
ncbi:MAG: spore coat U domain-containing protein [Candidatus Aquirickettsiella sp.]